MMSDATTDQPMHHGAPAHALERLIFFSDAVFAISITLLVIELKFPHLPYGASNHDFLQALAQMLPQFAGFVVSFFVVGAFWNGHHRAFTAAQHWSPRLVMPNLFLLLSVAGMPFFTALVSDYYGRLVPSAAYCAWLVFVAVCNLWNNSMAVAPPVAAFTASVMVLKCVASIVPTSYAASTRSAPDPSPVCRSHASSGA